MGNGGVTWRRLSGWGNDGGKRSLRQSGNRMSLAWALAPLPRFYQTLRMPTCDCILLACSLTTLSGQSFSQAPARYYCTCSPPASPLSRKGKFSAQPHLLPLRMHHNNFRSHELRPTPHPRLLLRPAATPRPFPGLLFRRVRLREPVAGTRAWNISVSSE